MCAIRARRGLIYKTRFRKARSLSSLPQHFKANSLLAGHKVGLCVTVIYQVDFSQFYWIDGGESGIRTRVTVSRKHTFQACAFNHSATSPSLHSRRPVLPRGLGRCIPLGSAGETRVTGAANQRMPFPAPVNQTGAGLI